MSDSGLRDVSDIGVPRLLMALVNQAWPIGLGERHPLAGQVMSLPEAVDEWRLAERAGAAHGNQVYFDYVRGRRLKLDFSDARFVDPFEYDRFYGEGAFDRAVASVREAS